MDDTKIMHDFTSKVILDLMNKKAELAATCKGDTMEARDLITLFMEKRLKQTENIRIEDDDARYGHDLCICGQNSTTHSICWFIVNINRYLEVLKKIREEMEQKLPGLLTRDRRRSRSAIS
ncbi:hypothetical protein V7S43_003293 [Phytophthora oleae]|uniref:Uncharacterized protein n=1 Tax=Phytophthora oleae TaxID=2107226 RepID=A0ABD3FZZ0_9STRA